MDRNDSEPSRPTLFKAVRAQPAPADMSPRILAETRKDAISPRAIPADAHSPGSTKYLWLTLLAVLVLGAVGLALLLVGNPAPPPPSQEKTTATIARAIAVAQPGDDVFGAPSVAPLAGEQNELVDPLDMLTKNAPQAVQYPEDLLPGELLINTDPSPAIIYDAADADSQSDLLDSLLTNIQRSQTQAVAPKGEADLQAIHSSETESVQELDSAIPSGQLSAELQAILRDCPSANTEKGMECRRNACAQHKGNNPVCLKHNISAMSPRLQ